MLARGRWMRREPAPHHFAREAQSIEKVGSVSRDAPRQHVGFPGRGRHLVALELGEDLQDAVNAVEL